MIKESIQKKLEAGLQPSGLYIVDESHLHQGHLGPTLNHETHFAITIVSSSFEGLSLLQRHRKIYTLLAEEMSTIHALRLSLKTPTEK